MKRNGRVKPCERLEGGQPSFHPGSWSGPFCLTTDRALSPYGLKDQAEMRAAFIPSFPRRLSFRSPRFPLWFWFRRLPVAVAAVRIAFHPARDRTPNSTSSWPGLLSRSAPLGAVPLSKTIFAKVGRQVPGCALGCALLESTPRALRCVLPRNRSLLFSLATGSHRRNNPVVSSQLLGSSKARN